MLGLIASRLIWFTTSLVFARSVSVSMVRSRTSCLSMSPCLAVTNCSAIFVSGTAVLDIPANCADFNLASRFLANRDTELWTSGFTSTFWASRFSGRGYFFMICLYVSESQPFRHSLLISWASLGWIGGPCWSAYLASYADNKSSSAEFSAVSSAVGFLQFAAHLDCLRLLRPHRGRATSSDVERHQQIHIFVLCVLLVRLWWQISCRCGGCLRGPLFLPLWTSNGKKGSVKWRCEHAQSRGFLGNFVNLHNATS